MNPARVTNLEAVRDAKVAIIEFGDKARMALMEANGDVVRTINRIRGEMLSRWQQEVKKWTHKLAEAKTELARAQLQSQDLRPSCIIERKAVEKAQRHLEEAHRKIERIRHWSRALEREHLLFKGQCQQLDRAVESEVPRAAAMIERMMDQLEAYVQLKAPAAAPTTDDGTATQRVESAQPVETNVEMRPDEPEADEEQRPGNEP